MDVITASFLVIGVLGAIAAALHLVGWIPPRYRRTLAGIQYGTAQAIANALQGPLRAFSDEIRVAVQNAVSDAATGTSVRLEAFSPVAIGEAFEGAMNRFAAAQKVELEAATVQSVEESLKSARMSMTRAVGVDRHLQAKVDLAMADAILGPAMPILNQFAPGLAKVLSENPQLVSLVIEHPLFQKYVAPRIAQFLGQNSNSTQSSGYSSAGWGT